MARMIPVSMLLLVPLLAAAQDGAQAARLEQEVRHLQREVLILSQLVNDLRARADRPAAPVLPPASPPAAIPGLRTPAPAATAEARWVDAGRWRSLRTGMSELEVIGTLGPPTSMRETGTAGERVLLYALEIGSSGFLAGSVTLRDRVVAAIETPILK